MTSVPTDRKAEGTPSSADAEYWSAIRRLSRAGRAFRSGAERYGWLEAVQAVAELTPPDLREAA